MTESIKRRLIIDLEKCDRCDRCGVQCDDYTNPQNGNGINGLREKVAFAMICRRCEQASCVMACPFEALERQPQTGIIMRYNLRCVSCKSCALACPFGTIYNEMLPFYSSQCDQCLAHGESAPPCVATCTQGALEYRRVDPDETDIRVLDEHVAARVGPWARQWNKHEVTP